jgi:hypothetical protein
MAYTVVAWVDTRVRPGPRLLNVTAVDLLLKWLGVGGYYAHALCMRKAQRLRIQQAMEDSDD